MREIDSVVRFLRPTQDKILYWPLTVLIHIFFSLSKNARKFASKIREVNLVRPVTLGRSVGRRVAPPLPLTTIKPRRNINKHRVASIKQRRVNQGFFFLFLSVSSFSLVSLDTPALLLLTTIKPRNNIAQKPHCLTASISQRSSNQDFIIQSSRSFYLLMSLISQSLYPFISVSLLRFFTFPFLSLPPITQYLSLSLSHLSFSLSLYLPYIFIPLFIVILCLS